MQEYTASELTGSEIAIIGMAGRFPGARDLATFWRNLRDGAETMTRLSDAELSAAGVTPAELNAPDYVKVAPVLDNIEAFDAAFFGFSPLEAELTDPQQRIFLECVWEALEDAGYNPDTFSDRLGVFAGSRTNTYVFNIVSNPELFKSIGVFQVSIGNDLASLATRTSYKLNLKGPSYAVHTACSTSLVAVHLARQSLLIDECRMAVAGGVAINVPHRVGYLYEQGGVLSPDGQCRAFDAEARGTVFGSGAGVVVLKRLEDALADGDSIYAVIKGSATNNDGAFKASFTAPSVDGQAQVIVDALADAEVEADSISYVEAHGTGTQLGDPIEVRALTKAFRSQTERKGFCAIGSVKTNIGHLDAAAGISSLIKTVLALHHQQLPPSLNFSVPNPRIDFAGSPFFVNSKLREWTAPELPRRAGVSSFGFGGTNAHVILEQAPPTAAPEQARSGQRRPQLLVLSARSAAALEQMTANLASRLRDQPDLDLADVAYTLQVGRKLFDHRRILVCHDHAEAISGLEQSEPPLITDTQTSVKRPVAFLFPGQGSQYVGMAAELYQHEPVFRAEVDRCAALLRQQGLPDLRVLIFAASPEQPSPLDQTAVTQPTLFVIAYALAQLWISWGVHPDALLGHSIGEYVAATLAGVFTLEDALALVARRGQLMQQLPAGAMLSVTLPEDELYAQLGPELSLAAVNAPGACVVAGPSAAIAALERRLLDQEVHCRRLHTSHAFHSAMVEPILAEFEAAVRRVPLRRPQIAYVSNLSGTWITPAEATDPRYWARHLRETVRFSAGIATLVQHSPARVLLEVGPGTTLSTFARRHDTSAPVLASLRHPQDTRSDSVCLLTVLGQLWIAGVPIDWAQVTGDRRRRVALPTYPFERQRYWIEAQAALPAPVGGPEQLLKKPDIADWFYRPVWQRSPLPEPGAATPGGTWLVLTEADGIGQQLADRLEQSDRSVVRVVPGDCFSRIGARSYQLDPGAATDYDALLAELDQQDLLPETIVHGWAVRPDAAATVTHGWWSLIYLVQAFARLNRVTPLQMAVLSEQMQSVSGDEQLDPLQATLLGPCQVIPKEYPNITCRSIDLDPASTTDCEALLAELSASDSAAQVAYRAGERWVQRHAPVQLEEAVPAQPRLRQGGVYLITGGLGGIGLALAEYLAETQQARLILTGRSALPDRDAWTDWLATHPDDDPISARLRQIQRLERYGAQVLVLRANVADYTQMQVVIGQAVAHFGALHGVIHAAGIAGGGVIQLKTPQQAARVLEPKVQGARVLDAVTADLALDFMFFCSSIGSVLAEFGQVDYVAANAFMDVLAERRTRTHGYPTIALAWDDWQEVGLAVNTAVPDELKAWRAGQLAQAITSAEGVEVFARVLRQALPRVIVSTRDLDQRLAQLAAAESQPQLPGLGLARPGSDPQPATINTSQISRSALEQRLSEIWRRVLGVSQVSLHDNFFDLGGNSLSAMQLIAEIKRELNLQITPVTLFAAPSISALVKQLSPEPAPASAGTATRDDRGTRSQTDQAVAIVGMHGRFPGASQLATFWQNLRDGVESVTFFSDQELLAAGVKPALLSDPSYIKARPVLDGVDAFDAAFFGYTPREAELMDPQHRVFLECAWSALDHAGYSQSDGAERIGVFAGSSLSTYLLNLYSNRDLIETIDPLATIIGNAQDSLATSVSYKLNLKGPSLTVQTFCSTSLVAVHLACQSLRSGECELALAGGASILVPQESGYRYQEGGILSPDGHSRTFDADGRGTLFGNGVGLVVLKPLEAALADGDSIYAVIRGSAINNDGSLKAGYTAPSVDGQATVIRDALADAGVSAESISYIEAHGTATELGDPIEIAALTQAFRVDSDKTGFCAIGSVKTNIGHLDRAAGVAALVKTVLALQHQQIPPSLHFQTPNSKIDFASSPFYVNIQLSDWPSNGTPRRAGVSSLGFGGTNAHVIVEEAPPAPPAAPARPWQLLLLSAKTEQAVETMCDQLAAHLRAHPDLSLEHVGYTLQVGRWTFPHRRALVCHDRDDAVQLLETRDQQHVLAQVQETSERPVAFLFPGQGAQYVGMAADLYQHEPVFRAELDRCAALLQPLLDLDLRAVLYPAPEQARAAEAQLQQTALAQPALFAVEYALAQLLRSWGVHPDALLGHSIGEYVAATLAGVFTLEDALALVARRGQLMQQLPHGRMVSVAASAAELEPQLRDGVSLAAINGPQRCVIAGPPTAVAATVAQLEAVGLSCRDLATERAFHSAQVEPVLTEFEAAVAAVSLRPPQIRFISNVSGTWITPEQATDPAYWARQMRAPVHFADGINVLLQTPGRVLVEVGPAQTLTSLAQKHPSLTPDHFALATMRRQEDAQPDRAVLLAAIGRMWLAGMRLDWRALYAPEQRRRCPLPTYPFERQRFWIMPGTDSGESSLTPGALLKPTDWPQTMTWKRARLARRRQDTAEVAARTWLVFATEEPLSAALVCQLEQTGDRVILVRAGTTFQQRRPALYELDPQHPAHYQALYAALRQTGQLPMTIVHLWSTASDRPALGSAPDDQLPLDACASLFLLARAFAQPSSSDPAPVWVVANATQSIHGDEPLRPAYAPILAACRSVARAYPMLHYRMVDVVVEQSDLVRLSKLLLDEIRASAPEMLVAYRSYQRLVPAIEATEQIMPDDLDAQLTSQGSYVVTSGLSEPGFRFATYLARAAGAQLTLLDPQVLPPRAEWSTWVDSVTLTESQQRTLDQLTLAQQRLAFDLEAEQSFMDSLEARLTSTHPVSPQPPTMERDVNELCASAICEYLAASGLPIGTGARYTSDELAERLSVQPRFAQLYRYMIAALAEDKIVELTDDQITFISQPPNIHQLKREMYGRYPDSIQSLEVLEHCVRSYREVLSGQVEAIRVLYPNGSSEMVRAIEANQVRHSNIHVCRQLVVQLLAHIAQQPLGHPLKILEVGAGEGTLTWEIVAALKPYDVTYHVTDIGRSFVLQAQKRAAELNIDDMTFGVLDITQSPLDQGVAPHSFDIILASEVLHATPNIVATLDNLNQLLAPNGVLCIIEAVRAERWANLVWGMLDGWWNFTDAPLRQSSPLLGFDQWEDVLSQQDAYHVAIYPGTAEQRAAADHGLMLLQRPIELAGSASQIWLADARAQQRTVIRDKLARLVELEAMGAQVHLVAGTADDPEQLGAAISEARQHFGAIHGLIQVIPAGDAVPAEQEPAAFTHALRRHMRSVGALEQALQGTSLERAVLVADGRSWLDGSNNVGGMAAAAFHTAYAYAAQVEGRHPWTSLEWLVQPEAPVEAQLRAIGQALAFDTPHILLAAQALPKRWNLVGEPLSAVEQQRPATQLHPRPQGLGTYVPPETETERTLVSYWQEILGIDQIGVHDNFMTLGGDSLQATQLLSRVRQTFPVELALRTFFTAPTVAEMAQMIDELQAQTTYEDEQDMLDVLSMLKDLSPEEVAAEIQRRQTTLRT